MAQIKIEVTFNTNEETLDQALAKLLSQTPVQDATATPTKKSAKQKTDAPATVQPDPQPDAAPDPQPDAAPDPQSEAETEVKTDPASEETAPDATPAPEEKPVSKTDVRAVATALTKAGKRDTLKAIFKKFGGEKLSDIQEADYPALMRELVAANG